MKHPIGMSLILCLLVSYQIYAADYQVIAFGKHEVDPHNGQKTVIYGYKLKNLSSDKNGVAVFSVGDIGTEAPPLFDTRVSSIIDHSFVSPKGWKGEEMWLEESYSYSIRWKVAEINDMLAGNYYLLPGQSSDQFSVRLTKVDPKYANVQAMVQGKLINMIKADTAAPTAEIYLTTLPAVGK